MVLSSKPRVCHHILQVLDRIEWYRTVKSHANSYELWFQYVFTVNG